MEIYEMQDDTKKKTFFQLLSLYNIKIPIIQRDYAQGRRNEKADTVRKNIIEALKSSLENKTNLDLNFVYGTVQEAEDVPTFLPIDGQQRLTTLYLLYYYFYAVNGKIEDFNRQYKSFTYATRTSATEFFSWLRSGNKELMDALVSSGTDLKNAIYNMPAYQAAWNNDPTVIAAITMLADIKEGVGKNFAEKYYSRLIDDECPITFSVIMEECKENAEMNADKAYIRMNARGKMLEDFENLRSMIDSIDEENVRIIMNYDQNYLDRLYNVCKCNEINTFTLKVITESINRKSYAAFMNIYNIVALSFGELDFKKNEVEYRNYMYECSKKKQHLNETALSMLHIYIAALDTYFKYCNTLEAFEYNNCIFIKNSIQRDIYDNNIKNVIMEVLYCYFYQEQRKELPTKKQVSDLIYVMNNLEMKNWANFYVNIRKFCEKIAQYNDVFEFFLNVDTEHRDDKLQFGIPDLNVRLKEQAIKTKLLRYVIDNGNVQNIDYRYFEQYEQLCTERKLQFFLYITGCWEGTSLNTEIFDNLVKNLKKGKKWFFEKRTEELEFMKLYAIAANMDESNKLDESETINRNCTENKHIWDRKVCFWSDEDEYNLELNSKWKDKCALAKKTYCMETQYFETAKRLLQNSVYNNCWLKYAVMSDHKELMNQKLRLDENNNLLILLDKDWKKYMMYVYKLKYENIMWGDKTIQKCYTRAMQIPHGENILPISKKIVQVDYTFNATLRCRTELIIKSKEFVMKDDCMYLSEEDNSTNTYTYRRYRYQADNPSQLLVEEYEITEDVKNLCKQHECEKNRVDSFNLNEFLELYEEAEGWGYRQRDSKTIKYHRGQGNSRTWTYDNQIESLAIAKKYLVNV